MTSCGLVSSLKVDIGTGVLNTVTPKLIVAFVHIDKNALASLTAHSTGKISRAVKVDPKLAFRCVARKGVLQG
jgi:hypothetical protein